MGKVEKLIVLSVLFVVAVILVVSLTMDDPLKKDRVTMADGSGPAVQAADKTTPSKTDPAAADRASASLLTAKSQAQSTPGAKVAALSEAPKDAQASTPSPLLSANIQAATPAPTRADEVATPSSAVTAGSILKTTEGLQDSYLPDMKFYTWQTGDNFRTVAFKYYGDYAKLTILRRANEGRQDIQAGEKILVPVFDADAPPMSAAAMAEPVQGSMSKSASTAKATSPASKSDGPHTHLVKDGESLWKIAKQELGAGSRWNEIYEANRDVLASPEAVHTGQRLRIP